MKEDVILVDEQDTVTGTMEKMEAHLSGRLHRAISVFIFNTKGELLIQQRALDKYHSGGKWSNTCCSHPRPGEDTTDAAHRRLFEEMGLECKLRFGFSFIYYAEMATGLSEHEFDHVYLGISDNEPVPDPEEVAAYKYISADELETELRHYPEKYTEWLNICLNKLLITYQNMAFN